MGKESEEEDVALAVQSDAVNQVATELKVLAVGKGIAARWMVQEGHPELAAVFEEESRVYLGLESRLKGRSVESGD